MIVTKFYCNKLFLPVACCNNFPNVILEKRKNSFCKIRKFLSVCILPSANLFADCLWSNIPTQSGPVIFQKNFLCSISIDLWLNKMNTFIPPQIPRHPVVALIYCTASTHMGLEYISVSPLCAITL